MTIDRNDNVSFGNQILDTWNFLKMNLDDAYESLKKWQEKGINGNSPQYLSKESAKKRYQQWIHSFQKHIKSAEKELQDFLDRKLVLDSLDAFLKNLNNMLSDPQTEKIMKKAVLVEFVELAKPIFKKEDSDKFLPINTTNDLRDAVSKLIELINNRELSDDSCLRILESRREYMEVRENELIERVEQYKIEFKKDIEKNIDSGKLPKNALDNLNMIDEVNVKLVDWLENIGSQSIGWIHDEDYGKGGIIVDSRFLYKSQTKDLKHIVYHELTHAIEGIAVDRYKNKHSGYNTYKKSKAGLSIKAAHGSHRMYNGWLNEATVELVTLILLSNGNNIDLTKVSYRDQLQTLQGLFDKGLTQMDVLKAYFENITEEQSVGKKGVHMAYLIKKMNKIEPGSYIRLNNMYELDYVAKKLESMGLYAEEEYIKQGVEYRPGVIFKVQAGLNEKTNVIKNFVFTKQNAKGESLKNILDILKLFEGDWEEQRGIKIIEAKIVDNS